MLIPLHRLQARLLVAVLAIAVACVSLRIYPHDLPALDSHAENRALIFTGRITLLCVAGFVVLSIVARALNRQWLTKAGPFEVSTTADAEIERDELKEKLAHANETISRLTFEIARQRAGYASEAGTRLHTDEQQEGVDRGSR